MENTVRVLPNETRSYLNVGAGDTKQMRLDGRPPVCHQRRLPSSWWRLWAGGDWIVFHRHDYLRFVHRSDSAQSPNLGINYNQPTVGWLGSGGPAILLAIQLIPRRRRWLMPHRSWARPGHLRVREAAPAGRRYSNHGVSHESEPICFRRP